MPKPSPDPPARPFIGLLTTLAWAVVAGLASGFLASLAETTPLSIRLGEMFATALSGLFELLRCTAYRSGSTITVNGFSMSLAPVTLAGPTLSIVSFPVLLYPARWHRKLAAWLAVVLALSLVNFLRLLLLGALGFWSPGLFEFVHQYLFQWVFIAAIFVGFEGATRWMDRDFYTLPSPEDQESPSAPIPPLAVPWLRVLALSLVWIVVASAVPIAIGLPLLLADRFDPPASVAIQMIFALESAVAWWALGSITALVASDRSQGNVGEALWEGARRLPDVLRAALYCSIWIWRAPVWPWVVFAALRHPGLSGRSAYREGKRLAEGRWLGGFLLVASSLGLLLGLVQAGFRALGPNGAALGAALALAFIAVLWAVPIRTMGPLSGIDPDVFD
jgi:exosortase/archaeosortase family protein